jgi:zinc transporter, ZIP family
MLSCLLISERYARVGITGLAATRPPGLIMAFGAGVLISAVSYELVQDAFGTAGAAWKDG